jgi:UDP-glucuronate decarboxylase
MLSLVEREKSRPVNLGSREEVTIAQLAARIIALVGSGRVISRPLPEDDPRQRRPDPTRAWETLGWTPEGALERTLRWFGRVV